VPGWSRRLVPRVSIPGWVDVLLSDFDRVLMLGLYAATVALALRSARIVGARPAQVRADAVSEVVT
jgi:hypothetical protein